MADMLLIGGPEDGKLVAVESPVRPLAVKEPGPLDYTAAGDRLSTVLGATTYYHPRPIKMFGLTVWVMIHESVKPVPDPRTQQLLAGHLLSDKARAVASV